MTDLNKKIAEEARENLKSYRNTYGRAEKKVITPILLKNLRDGDSAAFEVLMLHYLDPLVKFLTVLTGEVYKAEEAAQETFIILWENRQKIDPEKNIKSYIYTIAKRTSITHYRNLAKQEQIMSDVPQLEYSQTGEDDLIMRETELLIEIIIAKMPTLRKKAYELSEQGLTNEEIAKKLNITKQAVAVHLSRARQQIKDTIVAFLVFILAA